MGLVDVRRHGPVATIVLNRPEARNALSSEMCEDLLVAAHAVDNDSEMRAVVIKGEGPVFCAGADLSAVSGRGALGFVHSFEQMLEGLARIRLPTVAEVHGAALGGGLQLACVCDFRLASSDARIGIPAPSLGVVVNFENVERLVTLAGVATAKEVLMAGRTYVGEEAVAAGLVSRVVEEDLSAQTMEFARKLAALAPLSVQGAKRAIQVVADHLSGARSSSPATVEEIDRLVTDAYASQDLQEGLRAMADRRRATFRGS